MNSTSSEHDNILFEFFEASRHGHRFNVMVAVEVFPMLPVACPAFVVVIGNHLPASCGGNGCLSATDRQKTTDLIEVYPRFSLDPRLLRSSAGYGFWGAG